MSGATASNTAGVVSISQMLTNSTNTVKAVIYLVTPTSGDDGSCVGDAFEIEVTVNPVAEVVATPDSEVICSEGSTNIQLSTPTSGTQAITYSWTAVITTPSTGGTISGFSDQSPSSLDKIIQPLTNSGTSPGVVTYTITPHIGDCAGRSIDVDVTVNPSGQADSVDDQIVCTGSSTQLVTFTTQNTVGITTYVWTMDTEIGAGLSGSGNLPAFTTVNITNAPIVAKVTVTPTFTNGGVSCPGPPETFTITVDPVAEVVATPASEVICSEDNTGIQLSTPTTGTQAITYSWTASITALPIGGTITGFTNQIPSSLDEIIQPLTNSGTSPGVVTYTITPHIGDCLGTEITVAVTVNPTAQVDGIDDQELCSGESTQLVVFNTENSGVTTTYTWTNDNTAIGLAASSGGDVTEIPVFKALNPSKEPITATITVTPTFTNGSVSCPGLGKTFTITVNPTPVISNKAPEPICSGDAFTVNPVNVLGGDIVPAGTTYTWTIKSADAGISGAEPSSAVGVISQTLTNSTNTVKAVIYLVTPTSGDDGSCVGDAFEIEVTVNPTPVIGDKIAPEICSNGLFEFEPVNVLGGDIVPLGTTYTWTVAANADVVGQSDQITTAQQKISQTLRNLTNTPKTLVYTVTPLVGTCAGDSFTVTVTINPTPEIAKKEAEICSENTFEVDPLTLAELGDIIPANTTYTWTVASNTNLTGQSDVSDRQSKISQTLTNLTNEVRTVIYTVTPYSEAVGGCEGLPFEIEVTVNPTPVIEDKIAPEICSNGDLNFVAVNGQDNDIVPVGTKYTWTIKTDNANIEGQLLEADPQDRVIQILRNLTITSQTIVYEVTPISGDCAGDTFELSVTVTPTPEIEDVESGICSEEFFVVEPLKGGGVSGNDIVPTNTVYTWTVVDNENVTGDVDEPSFQTIITQQLTNLTNEAQVVVYTVTPYAEADGSCPGETFEVRVTVNPKPTIEDVESEICSEEFFVVEPVNGGGVSGNDIVPTNTVYTWTVVDNENVTGDVDEPSFQTLITQQLTNMSNEEQVVVYTVTPYAEVDGSCPGETFEVRITVKPTPVISPKELVICSEDDFELGPIHGENGDIIPLGTKYIWMVIQNVGGIIGPTNEDSPQDKISSDALINPGNTPSVVVYEVTPISADGCEGDSFTLSITVKDPIVIQGDHLNYNGFGVSCFGAEDGFIQVTVSGGKLPTEDPDDYNYSWLGPDGFSANSKDISGLNPGTYILTVDDNSGLCLMTKSFEITEPTPVVVTEQISSYNGFEISCFGASDGSISLDVSGGAGGYTYAWVATNGGEIPSGMENQALLDNLIAGTYIVTVTDANGCAQDIDYTLRQPAPLELREIVDQRRNVLCYGEDTGQISLLATGGVKDYRYNLAGVDFEGEQVDLISGITGLNNYIFENLKAGVYTLSVLDLNGCVTALPGNITISQPDAPLAISNEVLSDYSGFNIACFGDLNGSISLQVSGGTAPYTYAWMGPNGFTSTALNLSGLGAGKYTLVIKDANDCILEKEFELVEPAPITVNALPQNVLCGAESNGNIFIRGFSGGTGNYQFLWVKDGVGEIRRTFVPEDLRNIGPGKYFLIATDENSCEYIEEFVITEPDPLVVSLMDKSDNLCFGENNGALTIDVTGGVGPYVYQWTGPNGYTSSNKDLGGLFSGVYELVLMDALQCTQSLTVTIDEPEEIIIEELIDNVSCFGGNNGAIRLTVSGGVPPYRYLWLGPNGFTSTSRDIRDLIAGEYELLITDQIGCVITREFEINQPEPIVIDANISSYNGFQISCKGGSDGFIDITITGGNGGYRIFWEGPNGFRSNLSKIEGLLPGAYELAVIDEKNCLQTAQYLLVAPEELLITEEDLIFKDVSCFGGKDGSLQVNITQASVGPYRFELVGKSVDGFPFAESVLVDELLYEFTGLRSGEYELTVSDANGCSLSELSGLKIDQPESPLNFDILKTDNTCYKSNDGKIQITPTGGTAPYTIIWTNGSQSFSMENLSPGLYGAIITDAKGCEVKFETELIEAPIFELREEVNRISCFGLKDGSINLNIVGGEAPLLIQWGHGPQEPILNNLEKGIYSVTIIDAGGCVIKKDFVINEPQPLELTGNVSDAFDCEDPNSGAINIIPFGGTAPYTFNWSNGENSQNLNNIGPGSYSLELIDANGCSIVRQFTILRPEALKISVSRTTERICDPRGLKSYFEVSISGGIAPYSIQWNRGNVSNNGASMETDELGVFIVTVKDSRGCPLEQSFQVIEEDPLIPEFDFKSNSYEFSYENLVNFDIQFSNLSQGVYKEIVWEFGDGSTSTQWEPIHKYAKPGTYQITLKLKDLDGCIVEMRKEIVITDFFFEVPNVFTPNGDGVNDYFYPKFLYIKDIHVMIMNKWGELIYESKDLDAAGWNGKLKEEDAVIGNYAYRIQFTTLDGRLIDRSSVFLLAR
ncbi:gliding motility-associated C-terminal domain-containing protein [Belliella aquatica]|nr:gliding motility-associated C-terminal domain-containing protein [Belliella aquatica]